MAQSPRANGDGVFAAARDHVFAIAYRMLGSVEDAEDLVQETFLRWQGIDRATIESPSAWLTTVVTRLALNQLRSARRTRETYVGPWLPEPLLTSEDPSPSDRAEMADSLSIAFLVLLERLSPQERAVYLLHDIFGYVHGEVARILNISEANCRQVLRRARSRLASSRARFHVDREAHARLLESFAHAVTSGDMDGVIKLLTDDAVLWADGGGRAKFAALRPVRGAPRVARFLVSVAQQAGAEERSIETHMVNALPAIVVSVRGVPQRVISIDVRGGRIAAIYAIANPDKLTRLRRTPASED